MNYTEKKEFIEHAKELARNLEQVTDEKITILIGYIAYEMGDLEVTLMINDPNAWFGGEETNWNENVIFNNINNFIPVPDAYLELNKLIEKAYGG